MKKKAFLKWIIFLSITVSFLWGCSGKGKALKTIQGDPESLYKQGLARFNKRDYPEALKNFEELKSSFPDSPPYTVWAELKIGDCHFFKKDYVEAIAAYEEFKKIHPTHEEIPYVQYQIGMAYFNQMRPADRDQTFTKKALSNFEYLVVNYPANLFSERAKGKIEVCWRHLVGNELEVGEFYYKQGKFQITAIRFEEVLEKYPKIPGEDKILFLLGMSYLELGQKEKARVVFTKIVNEYPKSSHYKETKKILGQDLKKPDKKIVFLKIKAKEPKKESKAIKAEPDGIILAKFEDERRQPVPLKVEKKVELIRAEERAPPLVIHEPAKAISPKEETKEESKGMEPPRPLGQIKEERIPIIPPPQAEPKTELKSEEAKRPNVDVKIAMIPEEEGRRVASSKAELRIESKPDGEKRIETVPTPSIRSKKEDRPKKEILPETGQARFVDTGQPIDITSDRVETYYKENLVVFKGNVTARQKDIVIYADTIEAVIVEDGKGIERVVAEGNVKIQQGLRVASCQRAIFFNLDQKVILTGGPKVWEGNDLVSGDEIVFDIEQDRVEVKGGQGEGGKAKIYPGEKIEKIK